MYLFQKFAKLSSDDHEGRFKLLEYFLDDENGVHKVVFFRNVKSYQRKCLEFDCFYGERDVNVNINIYPDLIDLIRIEIKSKLNNKDRGNVLKYFKDVLFLEIH